MAKPPRAPYDPLAYVVSCDFALALVKGMVEHDDGATYFGSTMGYRHYEEVAIKRGHCVRGTKTFHPGTPHEFRGEGTILTDKGREVYQELGLDRLPQIPNRRAEYWKWEIIFPPSVKKSRRTP